MAERRVLIAAAAAVALLAVPAATAKEFAPGDVRICGPSECVPIATRAQAGRLAKLIYTGRQPARLRRPALGVPYYELRFRNGYATGIVATRKLDRFLSYGVYLERFERDRWYALQPALARDLQRLSRETAPFRLTRAALAKSR